MKFVHIVTAIVFLICLLVYGNNWKPVAMATANLGFWLSFVAGSLVSLVLLVLFGIMVFGGGAAGAHVGGAIGAIFGAAGGFVMFVIIAAILLGTVMLAVFGYHALGAWAAGGFVDRALMIRTLVCLGLSFLLSLLTINVRFR